MPKSSSAQPPPPRRPLIDLNLPALPDDDEESNYSVSPPDRPPTNFSDGDQAEEEEEEEDQEEEEVFEEVEEDPVAEEPTEVERKVKRKQSDYEVFVGGLDREAMEEDLEEAFKDVGEVMEVRLVRQPRSRLNKGFAFVRFATLEQASRAVKDLKVAEVRGKLCGVMRRNAKETLYVRNICTTWTKDVLTEELKAHKLINLEEVHLVEDPQNKGRNRGFAFLDFSTHMDAVVAFNKLRKERVYLGVNVRIEVTFAKTNLPDAKVMAKVKSVFLDGLPATWDESRVCEHFQKYGAIENVELACNMPNAKRQNFGFITFQTRDAALACIDGVNELGVVEGTEKVCVKATLRIPSRKQSQQNAGGWRAKPLGKYYHDKVELRHRRSGDFYYDRSRRSHESVGRDYESRSHAHKSYTNRRVVLRSPSPSHEKYGARFRKDSVREVPVTGHRDVHYEDSFHDRRELVYERGYHQPSYSVYRDEVYVDGYYESGDPAACGYPSVPGLKRPYSAFTDELASEPITRQSVRGYGSVVDAYNGVSSDDEYRRFCLLLLPSLLKDWITSGNADK